MANRGWFSRPVGVWLSINVSTDVNNVRQAARLLLYHWPTDGGPAHLAAREKCLSCMEGGCVPDDVREAFEEAAREAGILAE